jgi:hypothetical protein
MAIMKVFSKIPIRLNKMAIIAACSLKLRYSIGNLTQPLKFLSGSYPLPHSRHVSSSGIYEFSLHFIHSQQHLYPSFVICFIWPNSHGFEHRDSNFLIF